jgi:sigma-B regulation protein RsbU (phosphoserine phosphatase)
LAELFGFAMVLLVVLADAVWITYRERKRFLLRWRAESSRHRDRLRMKQELEYARSIQLSMLPRSAPALDWLDIAALSLPATEVGGDYYDYFQLGPERLAVVVGDVTGHGVASGLVLSGVRSSLNLLQEELGEPARVLGRMNGMLKKISTPRMLMTLGLAVLDRRGRSLTVATAAHPPLLRLGAGDDRVEELGRGSLPLGAIADTRYAEDRTSLQPGDLLLLYSDGLVEAVDQAGEQYGWDRLCRALGNAASTSSAQEVRDALLRDVWEFKGDAEQVDDVTMVVVRVLR